MKECVSSVVNYGRGEISTNLFQWKENDQGQNDQGQNDQGQNDQGQNDQGQNDQGQNDQGQNDQGQNDQGQNDQGQKLIDWIYCPILGTTSENTHRTSCQRNTSVDNANCDI